MARSSAEAIQTVLEPEFRRVAYEPEADPLNQAQTTLLRKVLVLRQLASRDSPIVEGYALLPELARAVRRRPLVLRALEAVAGLDDELEAAATLRGLAAAYRGRAARTSNAIDWLFYHITAGQLAVAAASLERNAHGTARQASRA